MRLKEEIDVYYINSNEISGDHLHEKVISSHVKIACYHGYPMQTRAVFGLNLFVIMLIS